jgi:hypothetical protein
MPQLKFAREIMAFSQRLLPFNRRTHRFLCSSRRLFHQSLYGFQSTQAVGARSQSRPVEEGDPDNLDDVFELLETKRIAWNRPGPAQFDFRSSSLHPSISYPAYLLSTAFAMSYSHISTGDADSFTLQVM